VGKDVSPSGLLRVIDKNSPASGVADDHVGQDDGKVELVRETADSCEHLPEELLALGELAAAAKVGAEEAHDGIDDKKLEGLT